jgi:NAD-dependent dihydropyrimidine dehydrogenase PreA subunit
MKQIRFITAVVAVALLYSHKAEARWYSVCVGVCPVTCIYFDHDTGAESETVSFDRCSKDGEGKAIPEVGSAKTPSIDDLGMGPEGKGVAGAGGDTGSDGGTAYTARSYHWLGAAAAVLSQLARDGGTLKVAQSQTEKIEQVRVSLTTRITNLQAEAADSREVLSKAAAADPSEDTLVRVPIRELRNELATRKDASLATMKSLSAMLAHADPFRADLFGQYYGLLGGEVFQDLIKDSVLRPPVEILPSFLTPSIPAVEGGLPGWLNWEKTIPLSEKAPSSLANAHQAAVSAAQYFLTDLTPETLSLAEALLGEAISVRELTEDRRGVAVILCDAGAFAGFQSFPWDGSSPPPPGAVSRDLPLLLARQQWLEDAVGHRASEQLANPPSPEDEAWSRVSLRGLAELLASSRRNLANGRVLAAREAQATLELLLEVTTSLSPGLSTIRDLVEAVTGFDAITGRPLSEEERDLTMWSVMTFGVSGLTKDARWIVDGVSGGRTTRERAQAVREVVGADLRSLKSSSRATIRPINQWAKKLNVTREELLLHFQTEGTMYRDLRPGQENNLNILLRNPLGEDYMRVTVNPARDTLISARNVQKRNIQNRVLTGTWVPLLKPK